MAKTNSKIKSIIPRLIAQLENNNIRVRQIILFGSYANGKATAYSDIDLAIISPSFRGKGTLERQELLGESIYPLQEPIEALGYTPQEFKHIPPTSFLFEIAAHGIVVFKSRN
ncbi:MAG: nucleotidyltransferase domain-containing protein [Candidatus Omnitrophica bacterium]|nr:nucleotidyltransferase domain-containing protein [Candidatus Omnitrophota bacterium]